MEVPLETGVKRNAKRHLETHVDQLQDLLSVKENFTVEEQIVVAEIIAKLKSLTNPELPEAEEDGTV